MISVPAHPLRFLALALFAVLAVGCGPTANALRPTLPPRSIAPLGDTPTPAVTPSDGGDGGDGGDEPQSSRTPPPPGIAQPMTGFTQGSAYEVTGVTATPNGFVAVGFAGTGQGYFGARQGVVWTSPDGMNWQQSADPAFLDVSPDGVVALGNDLYIFGKFYVCSEISDEECTEDPNSGTVIFKSADGGPWQQLAQTADIIQAEIDDMIAWDSTLVAWGYSADEDSSALWTSKDGLTWTPTQGLGDMDPIDSVGAGGPGLVALGEQYVESIEDTQLIGQTSADGLTFTAASLPAVTGAQIMGVVAGPGGMVAVGSAVSESSPSAALSLFSADGTNWSQATASDRSFEDSEINDVHSAATEYVAVGSTIGEEDFTLQTGRVWVSADGQTWRSLGDFGGSFSQYGQSALGTSGLVIFTADEQDANDEGTDVDSTIYGWFLPMAQLAP